jgi:hypothetical protein
VLLSSDESTQCKLLDPVHKTYGSHLGNFIEWSEQIRLNSLTCWKKSQLPECVCQIDKEKFLRRSIIFMTHFSENFILLLGIL